MKTNYRVIASMLLSIFAATFLSAAEPGPSGPPPAGPPVIEIWYGDVQEFGIHGEAQVWCNIQGHVFDTGGTIASLSYTLNGGASVALSIGPDNRRLLKSGNFNIDLTVGNLVPGANTVQITAVDNDSNPTVKSITVNYTAGNAWPLPYSVDWSTLADSSEMNAVAHVVDGNWTLTADGIRTAEPGYDRLIAIGDKTWTNYEVVVPFTIHNMPSGAGVGVLLRWKGHTNDPVTCPQPRCGWQPLGDIAWYRPGQLQFYEGNNVSRTIPLELTQMMRVSVETDGSAQTTYKMKVWEQGTTEPVAWDLSYVAGAADEMAGSLMLISHMADVTFGNVSITAGALSISNIEVQLANGNTEATISWNTNQPTSSRIDHGPTPAYEDGFMQTPALVTSHSMLLTGLMPNTIYHYALSGENAASELVSTADRIFSTFDSGIVSDDFCASTLAPMWTFNDPLADASYTLTGSASSDAWLEISVPAGPEHQVYNSGINAPGLLQPMSNADFEVEVKFESPVEMPEYQEQGVLVKESASKFLRFEFFSKSPGNTILYAQAFDLPATSPAAVNTSIGASGIFPLYMRVKREGNQWTLTYSFNGTDWLPGTSFSFAMDPNEIGPYAGNALGSSAPAHIGKVDYFMNLGDPIGAEDGCVEAAPILALIGDRSVEEGGSLNVGISANDPDGNETDLVFSSTGLPAFAQLVDNGDGTADLQVDPLPGDAGTYPVTVTVTDLDLLFDEETFDIVVSVPPMGMISDDFCAGTLGVQWSFVDPLGDGSMQFTDSGTPDAALSLSVPAGVDHQVWTNGIRVPHIAQATSDDDLSVEVKLLSAVNAPQYQEQGLFFKQDDHHFLRFEVYSTNSNTRVLAAVLSSATNSFPLTSSIPVNVNIGALGVAPVYMRVERVGYLWTQSYSFDGSAWQVAGSFTAVLDAAEVGLYAGNESGAGSPAHTASFDYFEDLNAPLVTEDGCQARVELNVRMFLDGPYDEGTGLMADSLRKLNMIPQAEPYTVMAYPHVNGGGESLDPGLLTTIGDGAIVDWVLVELRDAVDPSVILATQSALLQRDGDVVAADGSVPLVFEQAAGQYHVAVRHRNHLGCMTDQTLGLSGTATLLDFTDPLTSTWGTDAQKERSGVRMLWAGNALWDNEIIYTGGSSDRDRILLVIGGTIPTNVVVGYAPEDLDLDGKVMYSGSGNDRDVILQNIGGSIPTNTKVEQLP